MGKPTEAEKWDYKIDGKTYELLRMTVTGALAAFFLILAADQLKPEPNKYPFVALVFAVFGAQLLWSFARLSVRYFCLKIYLGREGFYFKTNPLNGKYYKYSDVAACGEETLVSRRIHSAETHTYSYFTFTLKNGERKKVQFEKSVHGKEFDRLKKRKNANN